MKKRYSKYKSSGVEWIGEIPSHWKMSLYKHHITILSGFPFKSELFDKEVGFPLMRIRDITSGTIETFYTGDLDETYIIRKGDVVIGMDGEFNIRQWDNIDILLNQRCCKIQDVEGIDRRFIYYTLPFDLKIINDLTYYTTVKHLSVDDLKNIHCVVPPIEEQKEIVKYLDEKITQVDNLITVTENKIETLKEKRTTLINRVVTKGLNPNVKLKNSGFDWIGEIPNHWMVTKIRRYCEVKDGTHDTPDYFDKSERTYPLVTSNSFENGDIDFNKCKYISEKDFFEINKRSNVSYNDIIMSMIGSNIGNSVLVNTKIPFSIKNVCLFKTSESVKLNPKYLLYLIGCRLLKYQIDISQKGGGQPFLGLDELRSLLFTFPPPSEQEEIVKYLDTKTGEMDTLVTIEQRRIETLKEYRQSLISEVVTGKVRVCKEDHSEKVSKPQLQVS